MSTYAYDSANDQLNLVSGVPRKRLDNIESNIATVEPLSTASKAYAIGDQFVFNGLLTVATAAIAQGATITVGSGGNAELADCVADQLTQLKDALLRYPNFSNIITSNGMSAGNKTYTATTKCWAYAQATLMLGSNSTDMNISVNNETIGADNIRTTYGTLSAFFPLDIGDVLKVTTSDTTNGHTKYVIYGVK